MSVYFVIFGAAVREDGSPSGTLCRRVQGALTAAQGVELARYMPTGGAGAGGHIEADAINKLLLQAGVPDDAIISERLARDTLDSVRRCDALLRAAADAEWVTPCTSFYYLPRCVILFRAMGWKVRWAPMYSDRGALPLWKLLFYILKEMAALPYDLLLLVLSRKLAGYPTLPAAPKRIRAPHGPSAKNVQFRIDAFFTRGGKAGLTLVPRRRSTAMASALSSLASRGM